VWERQREEARERKIGERKRQYEKERAKLKLEGDLQGILAYSVDLSQDALNEAFGTKNMQLMQLPNELLKIKDEVRELTVHCGALRYLPEWLGELRHLEVLHLDGFENEGSYLEQLPASLGNLAALAHLTIENFIRLEILPASVGRLSSLETLRIEACDVRELPVMSAMPALKSLILERCWAIKELPCLSHLTALEQLSLVDLSELIRVPVSIGKLTRLKGLKIASCGLGQDEDEAEGSRLEALPISLGMLVALHSLTLKNIIQGENVAAILLKLTSLQMINIHDCPALRDLPAMSGMTRVTSLTLSKCAFKELPCCARLTALRHLSLVSLKELMRLPSSMGKLTGLRELRLAGCRGITELPSSIGALTALHMLALEGLPNVKALPPSIGALKMLTELMLTNCALTDVPWSIELLTGLRTLKLYVSDSARKECRAFKTLASALPVLRLLQRLHLDGLGEEDVAAIGRALKAWPLPLLDLDASYLFDLAYRRISLTSCSQALALPPEATSWDDATILQHWRVQQEKMMAFSSGLHVRLGEVSRVWSLNDVALVLIADEVLGGWSLLRLWQRERLQCESEAASMST